jgi:hypothetical protein
MQEYRDYLIGPDDIQSRVELICKHEEEAQERAKQLVYVELWQGTQKIETFKASE